jgi:hypothetical protein
VDQELLRKTELIGLFITKSEEHEDDPAKSSWPSWLREDDFVLSWPFTNGEAAAVNRFGTV